MAETEAARLAADASAEKVEVVVEVEVTRKLARFLFIRIQHSHRTHRGDDIKNEDDTFFLQVTLLFRHRWPSKGLKQKKKKKCSRVLSTSEDTHPI